MIRINLLPPEYRPHTGTPVARFAAIIAGVVMVLSATGAYAYTHFIELAKVTELRTSRQAEAQTKERLRDRSLKLQREIDMYEKRRRAIQTINRSRTLWSRKLDQFFDIVTGQGTQETFNVWLDSIEVPVQLTSRRTNRVQRGRQKIPAGEFRYAGFLAMESDTDAPALLSSFHKAITGDPENTQQSTEFFSDFMKINNPNIDMQTRQRVSADEVELVPPEVGTFKYVLQLKPIDLSGKPVKAAGR